MKKKIPMRFIIIAIGSILIVGGAAVLVLTSSNSMGNRLTPPGGKNPPVIMISIDTLRRDHLSVYGYSKPTTPNLDRIAHEGALFRHAVSNSPWTLPAHMSIFTGLSPSLHMVEDLKDRLPDRIKTISEVFKEKGYQTAAFVSAPLLDKKYGFDKGFDHYELLREERGEKITKKALQWLQDRDGANYFLFIHYFDVHWPYDPPKQYLSQSNSTETDSTYGTIDFLGEFSDPGKKMSKEILEKVNALYDGEIKYVDHQIGTVIDFLHSQQTLDKTIIVVFSDHGEEFKEHGSFGHGHSFHWEVINVPLIIRYPQYIKPGTIIDHPVASLDIPLTIMSIASISPPDQFRLQALNALEYPGKKDDRNRAFSHRSIIMESTRRGPKRLAILKNNYKYITAYRFFTYKYDQKRVMVSIPEGLYHCSEDPGEYQNLLALPVKVSDQTPRNRFPQGIYKKLRNELKRFTMQNAQGLHLIFSRTAAPIDNYQGVVLINEKPVDEPFSIFPGTHAFITPAGKNKYKFNFSLAPGQEEKIIIFPLSTRTKKILLSIQHNGKLLVKKRFPIPRAGKVIRLSPGNEADPEALVKMIIQREFEDRGALDLSTSELETLRSLGYIQ